MRRRRKDGRKGRAPGSWFKIDGQQFRVDGYTAEHARLLEERFSALLDAGALRLDGRTVAEAMEDWCKTRDATVYCVYVVIRDEYRRRTGRTLTEEYLGRRCSAHHAARVRVLTGGVKWSRR